ncbi:TPA: DUF2705 family protein [Listeria monocytogenes]|nr:DUF2705 family protein [Listeria monocytogenes]HCV3198741.1 DUF2705 family protein [Listeria monocytogenes]
MKKILLFISGIVINFYWIFQLAMKNPARGADFYYSLGIYPEENRELLLYWCIPLMLMFAYQGNYFSFHTKGFYQNKLVRYASKRGYVFLLLVKHCLFVTSSFLIFNAISLYFANISGVMNYQIEGVLLSYLTLLTLAIVHFYLSMILPYIFSYLIVIGTLLLSLAATEHVTGELRRYLVFNSLMSVRITAEDWSCSISIQSVILCVCLVLIFIKSKKLDFL